jgi:hypothetical protein
MASPFDQLQAASFAGYIFPWSRIRVSCSLRDHVHIYPHAPGGQPEKLGRNLYEFHFTCPFHQNLIVWEVRKNKKLMAFLDENYPILQDWPEATHINVKDRSFINGLGKLIKEWKPEPVKEKA